MFSGVESLDDFLLQPTTTTTASVRGVGRFRPKPNARSKNEKTITPPPNSSNSASPEFPLPSQIDGLEKGSSPFAVFDDSLTIKPCNSSSTISSPQLLMMPELANVEGPPVSESPVSTSDGVSHIGLERENFDVERGNISSAYEEYGEDIGVPLVAEEVNADQFSTIPSKEGDADRFLTIPSEEGDGFVFATMSVKSYEDLENVLEELPEGIPNEGPIQENNEEVHGPGYCSRQLRKRTASAVHREKSEDGADENWELDLETSHNSAMDDDEDEECSEKVTKKRRRAPKRSKEQKNENQEPIKSSKPRRGRKKASEGQEPSNKDPPKKKFPHSTRRNRRQLDKVLLETPEEEIDPTKLIMKDLILLAEFKERKLNKEAAARNKSLRAESTKDSLQHDNADDDDSLFASTQGLNSDDGDENQRVKPSCPKVNYHSFMVRTPSERWSKSETERFYKAIQEIGTNFEMIQELFPGRTRHQIKLKYKKEERRHRSQLHDALGHRSKDLHHLQLLVTKLQSERKPTSTDNAGAAEQPADEKEVEKDCESGGNSPLKSHESHDFVECDQGGSPSSSPQDTAKAEYALF